MEDIQVSDLDKFNITNIADNLWHSYEHDNRENKGKKVSNNDTLVKCIQGIKDLVYGPSEDASDGNKKIERFYEFGGKRGYFKKLEKRLEDYNFEDPRLKSKANEHLGELESKLHPYILGSFENEIYNKAENLRELYSNNIDCEEVSEANENEDPLLYSLDDVLEGLESIDNQDRENVYNEIVNIRDYIMSESSYISHNVNSASIKEEIQSCYKEIYELAKDYGYELGIVNLGEGYDGKAKTIPKDRQ